MSYVMWGAVTALCIGVSGFFARIVGRAIGPLTSILGNFVAGLIAIVIWFLTFGDPILWQWDGVYWLLAVALPFTIGSLLFYVAISRGPVSIAAPLMASYPAFVVISLILLGIYPTTIQWAAIGLVMLGIWVVARYGRSAAAEQPTGEKGIPLTIAISLATALLAGAGIMASREATPIYGPFQVMLVVRVIGVFVLLVILGGVAFIGQTHLRLPFRWWPAIALFGILDVGAVLALVIASQGEGASGVVASSPYAVITVLLAWMILREPIPLRQWLGIAMAVAGVGILAASG